MIITKIWFLIVNIRQLSLIAIDGIYISGQRKNTPYLNANER